MFCSQCGQPLIDGAAFCTNCGTKVLYQDDGLKEEMEPEQIPVEEKAPEPEETSAEYEAYQYYAPETSRAAAIVGYITWIGFIVAMVIGDRNDPHTRFHTNQALVLNLAAIICGIIMLIPVIGTIIGVIGYILVVIGWFIGIISAASGTMKRAPLFGKINFIR